MKKIVFEGSKLSKLFPDGIKVNGESAYECLSILRQYPQFQRNDLSEPQIRVRTPDFGSKQALMDPTPRDIIRVVEVEQGDDLHGASGRAGGILAITIGIVAIVFAPYLASVLPAALGVTAGGIASLGAMMVLNGIVQVMMPQPDGLDSSSAGEGAKSNYLPSNQNTTKVGTRILLVYGKRRVFGHWLSFNVTASDIMTVAPSIPSPNPNVFWAYADGLDVYNHGGRY